MLVRPKQKCLVTESCQGVQLYLRVVVYVVAHRQEIEITLSFLLLFLGGGKPLSKFPSANFAALKPRSLALSFLLTAENQMPRSRGVTYTDV